MSPRFRAVGVPWIPIPVIAEIHIGFLQRSSSKKARKAQRDFDEFVSKGKVIECDRAVAVKYAEISDALRRKGSIIPQNDMWVAACCLVKGKPLATRDAHFQRVSGLKLEI